jgi:hypothetical protein
MLTEIGAIVLGGIFVGLALVIAGAYAVKKKFETKTLTIATATPSFSGSAGNNTGHGDDVDREIAAARDAVQQVGVRTEAV